ncbi:MAG TPA: ATP-dependent 6-phosphofructokinase, partial [Syntrophales bacterium]|nr:ATP-dependent 6-phosphofructokinase [Syntrophales bacterium]
MKKKTPNFEIQQLGDPTFPSPITPGYFTPDSKRILYNRYLNTPEAPQIEENPPLSIEVAGPRKMIYFDPAKVHAAIVTCGGLSPGINDVIRAVVMGLYY